MRQESRNTTVTCSAVLILGCCWVFVIGSGGADGVAVWVGRWRPGSGWLLHGSAGGEQVHQRVPRGEDLVGGDGAQVLEQADSRAEPLACLLPLGFGEIAGRVQGEGEQVEDDQHAGQVVLAVAEVVLEVVAVLL